jgi:hypothetical protein
VRINIASTAGKQAAPLAWLTPTSARGSLTSWPRQSTTLEEALRMRNPTRALDEAPMLDEPTRQGINRGNALGLLPGLASRLSATPTPTTVR